MAQGIVEDLILNLSRLPGIGRKTAQRLAFFILAMDKKDALCIAQSIIEAKEKAQFCSVCFNLTEKDPCYICADSSRNRAILCVVEETSNITAIERTGFYKGLYHVLLGALSPVDGIDEGKLKIKELVQRLHNENIEEVIIATNPNTKGELTAKYITELIKPFGIKVSRIAYGLPIG
ncbi:MAG: recombination mediator RecR, partial [Thermodesulfovibrionales bacterium]|nr:recombination mediator RecR [Thermodesulfovibrionales bacterium]